MNAFWIRLSALCVVALAATQSYAQTVPSYQARALIEARQQALLSAELAGKIIEFPFQDGEVFQEDDLLVAFDCRSHQAQLAVEKSGLFGAQKTLTNTERLYKLGSSSKLDIDLAKAEVQRMQGLQQQAKVLTQKCEIRAPFSGKVVERHVRVHESVSQGDPLIEVLNHKVLEIKLVVPSAWLRWLKVGDRFQVKIDETGYIFEAQVARIGARIDPVSQTIKVIAHADSDKNLIPGMSGNALFAADVHD